MLVARVAGGRRGPGSRRLRVHLMTAVLALAMCAPAVAASGGAGIVRPRAPRPNPRAAPHPTPRAAPGPSGNPFAGRGMWIWVLGRSNGGDLASILAQAKLYGISTVMIKSGDGTSIWPQFNSQVVATLHANRLRACAWQYVYGTHPITEAYVGAAAVRAGADCLLIDAESEYEGRYVQAQAYIGRLRLLIGNRFPVALAGFPYVDYHPGFPYSVFLGPGGAQYNVPQMYWLDIGTSVDAVFAHTFAFNALYGRPIYPLGQAYNRPRPGQIIRFRQVSRAYGSLGLSWWDWQEAAPSAWRALAQRVGSLNGFEPYTSYATLGLGARGDLVVWAQEHLVAAGERVAIDGSFGPDTAAAVQAFQAANGLAATGILDTTSWQALLRHEPARVKWVLRKGRTTATVAGARVLVVPRSAKLQPRRDEIPPTIGAGRP